MGFFTSIWEVVLKVFIKHPREPTLDQFYPNLNSRPLVWFSVLWSTALSAVLLW